MEEVKRIDRKLIANGTVLEFYADTMQMPNGHTAVWDLVKHKGAAAILPVRDDGKLLLVRQYRNPVERVTLELPAGKKDFPGESGYDCAARELEEETGYRSDHIEPLLTLASAIAYSDEIIDIFLARDLIPSAQHLDDDEFLDVEACTADELKEKIFSGEIQDSKTIAAILAYLVKYEK